MREISLNKAKEYELLGINCIPRKQLCASCQKSIAKQSKSDDALVQLEQIDYVNDDTDVNSQNILAYISPISNHTKHNEQEFQQEKDNCHRLMMHFQSVYQKS